MTTRKYEQRLRAESAEETRRRILDAVVERLAAAPTSPVSVDRVAREAGVARSTVYLVFGSRAGLFDAVASDLQQRAGFDRIVAAVHEPDAREHLRQGIRAGVDAYVKHRDVTRTLFSMSALDPEAVGGAMLRLEDDRSGGMDYLAKRLDEQGLLRADVDPATASHVLYTLTSFDCFDLLYTGRGLSAEAVADLIIAQAERTLMQG